jgi:mannose-6-phosphate isomerase class I
MFKHYFKGMTAPASYNESNDCSVRAVANASGKSYEEVHAIMKALGRKDGQLMDMRMCAAGAMKAGGQLFIVESLSDYRLKQGKYVVFQPQHCFALINGEVVDTMQHSLSDKLLGIFIFKE